MYVCGTWSLALKDNIKSVSEQGAEENSWTWQGGDNRQEKIA